MGDKGTYIWEPAECTYHVTVTIPKMESKFRT
jgi:hypothetical protein